MTYAAVLLLLGYTSSFAVLPLPCPSPSLVTSFTESSEHVSNKMLRFGGGIAMEATVTLTSYRSFARIMDFSSGPGQDNVMVLQAGTTGRLAVENYLNGAHPRLTAPDPLPLNRELHIYIVVKDVGIKPSANCSLFVDGVEVTSGTVKLPKYVKRTQNLIKKSAWADQSWAGTVRNFKLWACAVPTATPAPATAVPTLAPATPSPPTDIPDTSAPDTVSPPTPSPPTAAPETPAPATLAPTPSPPTLSPDTLPPITSTPTSSPTSTRTFEPTLEPTVEPSPQPTFVTPAPTVPLPLTVSPTDVPIRTMVPETAVPIVLTVRPATVVPEVVALKSVLEGTDAPVLSGGAVPHVEETSATAAVGAVLTGGTGVGFAIRTAMVGADCAQELPATMNPTGLVVYGNPALGALLANMGITAGVALLALCVLRIFAFALRPREGTNQGCLTRVFKTLDLQGVLRLPSAPFVVFQIFFQGMTASAMNLVMYPKDWWNVPIGVAALVLCVLVPLYFVRIVLRDIPHDAVYAIATERIQPQNLLVQLLLGPGEWVNRYADKLWVQRYSGLVRFYTQPCCWYFIVDLAGSFAISAIFSTAPSTMVGCGHAKLATGVVFLVLLYTILVLSPHARPRDDAAFIMLVGMQAIASFFLAAAFYGVSTKFCAEIATWLLDFTLYIFLVKIVLDGMSEVYILWSGRRTTLQENILNKETNLEVELTHAATLEHFGHVVGLENTLFYPARTISDLTDYSIPHCFRDEAGLGSRQDIAALLR